MLYRLASAIALLVAVAACTVAPDAVNRSASLSPSGASTSCTGFAGMSVPNCDFSRPPAY